MARAKAKNTPNKTLSRRRKSRDQSPVPETPKQSHRGKVTTTSVPKTASGRKGQTEPSVPKPVSRHNTRSSVQKPGVTTRSSASKQLPRTGANTRSSAPKNVSRRKANAKVTIPNVPKPVSRRGKAATKSAKSSSLEVRIPAMRRGKVTPKASVTEPPESLTRSRRGTSESSGSSGSSGSSFVSDIPPRRGAPDIPPKGPPRKVPAESPFKSSGSFAPNITHPSFLNVSLVPPRKASSEEPYQSSGSSVSDIPPVRPSRKQPPGPTKNVPLIPDWLRNQYAAKPNTSEKRKKEQLKEKVVAKPTKPRASKLPMITSPETYYNQGIEAYFPRSPVKLPPLDSPLPEEMDDYFPRTPVRLPSLDNPRPEAAQRELGVNKSQSKDKNKLLAGDEWDRWTQPEEMPQNMTNIEDMIDVKKEDLNIEDIDEYIYWRRSIAAPEYTSTDAASWTKFYLGIPALGLNSPDFKTERLNYEAPPERSGLVLKLEYAEGIDERVMPPWTDLITHTISPGGGLSIPNFLAAFGNRDSDSMKEARDRAHDIGHAASQAYFRLLEICLPGRYPPATAFVGTIESNGEVIVGSVHWMVRNPDDSNDVRHHERVVFRHITKGISEAGFFTCREQARLFREYFCEVREEIWKSLCKMDGKVILTQAKSSEEAGQNASVPEAIGFAGPSSTTSFAGPSSTIGCAGPSSTTDFAGPSSTTDFAGPSSTYPFTHDYI